MKNEGKKRGKSSTLLTGSSLVLTQLMASSVPQQNVSAGFWDWFNPFNWNWAWLVALFSCLRGKSEPISELNEKNLKDVNKSLVQQKEWDEYFKDAKKELEKVYEVSENFENKSVSFENSIEVPGDSNNYLRLRASISVNFGDGGNYRFWDSFKGEKIFGSGEDFLKYIKKHIKEKARAEKIIGEMMHVKESSKYLLGQIDRKIILELHNKKLDFYYEENKTLEKMELNLEDMSITLYQKGSTLDGEKCSLESLPEKVNLLLKSIEDYNKKCIEMAKNCVDEVFGEANWKQDKEEKKWERSIEIESINLPVSVETGFCDGSKLYVLGKKLLGFSSNSEDSKTLCIEKIKEFKDFFEKYTKKFMSFRSKDNFKPSFDVERGRLVLVSSKPGYGVKVPGDMLGVGEDKLISKVEFDVLERKIYFWTDGKNTGNYNFMSMYEHFGQEDLGSEEEYPFEQKFDEFLEFLESGDLAEVKQNNKVGNIFSAEEVSE